MCLPDLESLARSVSGVFGEVGGVIDMAVTGHLESSGRQKGSSRCSCKYGSGRCSCKIFQWTRTIHMEIERKIFPGLKENNTLYSIAYNLLRLARVYERVTDLDPHDATMLDGPSLYFVRALVMISCLWSIVILSRVARRHADVMPAVC